MVHAQFPSRWARHSHHSLVAPDEPVAVQHHLSEVVQRASAGCLVVPPDGPTLEVRGRAVGGEDGTPVAAFSGTIL